MKNQLSLVGIAVLITVIFMNIGADFNLQNITLYLLFPGMFIISLVYDRFTLNIGNREILLFLYFILISLVIVFYENVDMNRFGFTYPKVIASFLAAYIPIGLNKSKNYFNYFHIGFVVSIIILILLEFKTGNFTLSNFAAIKGSRARFEHNANYYSYISVFANFSLFYLYVYFKNKITFFSLLFLPLLFLIVSFITQSRSGLILILIINLVFWFWILKEQNTNKLIKIGKTFLILLTTVFLSFKFIEIYSNSTIRNRVEDSGDDSRGALILEGLNIFAEFPLTGVGMGQFPKYSKYGLFTHNTYLEALAEHGLLVGFFVILIFFLPFVRSIQHLRRFPSNNVIKINFLFFLTFLFFNNVYVFYKASYAMMFFFLIISIQNRIEFNKNEVDIK